MSPLISGALAVVRATGLDDHLSRWISGKLGDAPQAAHKVLEVAGQVLKVRPNQVPQALNEIDLQARQELTLALEAKRLAIQTLSAKDRADARALQKSALESHDPVARRFIYFFAAFWSLAAVTFMGGITFLTIPDNNVRFADTILGFLLGSIVAVIINYFYGASESAFSLKKTDY